ncbi:hypothetical protein G5I_13952 [Acromyrmex echinatior]|uniref:Uncharacterized protein n=1 Tax=Acromyrmex echinatior TaxID=103372 RepID=F4X6D4_ACREC|nr:hypothetical protein G5I_13952 [Acromyrmex echinatior]
MNIGKSVSRLDLGLQNSSAMAHQARGLSQLRIKFYNTIVAGLQIVLLLTVLPQAHKYPEIIYKYNKTNNLAYNGFMQQNISYLLILETFNFLFLRCMILPIFLYAVIAGKALHLDWNPNNKRPIVETRTIHGFSKRYLPPYRAAPIRYELTSCERYIISEVHVNSSAESCDCGPESKRLIAHEDP